MDDKHHSIKQSDFLGKNVEEKEERDDMITRKSKDNDVRNKG